MDLLLVRLLVHHLLLVTMMDYILTKDFCLILDEKALPLYNNFYIPTKPLERTSDTELILHKVHIIH